VADCGVDNLVKLLLALNLVEHDALRDVVDLDHTVGGSLPLIVLFLDLDESEVRALEVGDILVVDLVDLEAFLADHENGPVELEGGHLEDVPE